MHLLPPTPSRIHARGCPSPAPWPGSGTRLSHQHLTPPPRVMPPPSTSLSLSVPHLDVNNLKTYAKRGVSMPYLGPPPPHTVSHTIKQSQDV